MKKVISMLLTAALLLSVIGVVAIVGTADDGAVEIGFRGFESASSDYNANFGTPFVAINSATYNTPAVGNGYIGAKANSDATEMHHFVYAYKQNGADAADGSNADGMTKMFITDPTKLYVSFDLYVSDVSAINNPTGDCGFGIDTLEFGTKENWGSTFRIPKSLIKPALQGLKNGWNHLVFPLTVASASLRESMANQTVTFCTMRLYAVGVTITSGFVSALDDVRIMNQQAALTTYYERTAAKTVTDGIRAYPASATYEDFYKVYLAYNATPDEYKSLIIGWDSFIAANASFKAQGDTDIAADKAAAAPVTTAIGALPLTITADTLSANKGKVEAARTAYDSLSENQKGLVINQPWLANAESQVASVEKKQNQAKADEVRNIIAALPKVITSGDKQAVEAARAAFNALTPAQQELVINTTILENAENALATALNQDAAKVVTDLIAALPATVTAQDTDQVKAARDAYNGLTDAQKEMVTNLDKLTAAEEALKVTPDPEPKPTEYRLGDLNGDDLVNAKDALLVLQFTVGKIDKFPIEK